MKLRTRGQIIAFGMGFVFFTVVWIFLKWAQSNNYFIEAVIGLLIGVWVTLGIILILVARGGKQR